MMVGVHVEDDGAVWKRANGSHEYQIKKDERKHSVHQCRIVITCMYDELTLLHLIVPYNVAFSFLSSVFFNFYSIILLLIIVYM